MTPEERESYDGVFAYLKQQAAAVPMDANMRALVALLNTLPGIATFACCGGHENPSRIQHAAGEWFVSFEVYRFAECGWDDLLCISGAVVGARGTFKGSLTLEIDHNPYKPSFCLDGKGINPNAFAVVLQREIDHRQRSVRRRKPVGAQP